jgi:hypothetical protein
LRKFVIQIVLVLIIASVVPLVNVVAESPFHPAGQDVQAKIDSPLPNIILQGRVQVKGSAVHPQFNFYKVEFGPGESPADEQMSIIGAIHEQQVTNNVLETWDTASIPDGTYTLRLRVVDTTGNYQEFWVRRLSVNNTSPTPTSTLEATLTPAPPTSTPTIIVPSPTIVVEQPFLDQPTATPPPPPSTVEPVPQPGTTAVEADLTPMPTPTPEPTSTPAPAVTDLVQPQEWGNALCLGALFMAGLFLLFGLLSVLRRLVLLLLKHR